MRFSLQLSKQKVLLKSKWYSTYLHITDVTISSGTCFKCFHVTFILYNLDTFKIMTVTHQTRLICYLCHSLCCEINITLHSHSYIKLIAASLFLYPDQIPFMLSEMQLYTQISQLLNSSLSHLGLHCQKVFEFITLSACVLFASFTGRSQKEMCSERYETACMHTSTHTRYTFKNKIF